MTIEEYAYSKEKWKQICNLVHSYPLLKGDGECALPDPEFAEEILINIFDVIHSVRYVEGDGFA